MSASLAMAFNRADFTRDLTGSDGKRELAFHDDTRIAGLTAGSKERATDDDGFVQILDGIAPGDLVVTSGQFLIDSESRLREGARKFENEGMMPGGDLPPPVAIPLTPASQQSIDALAAAYLAVSEALAQDRFDLGLLQAMRASADAVVTTATVPQVQLPATELTNLLDRPSADLEAARGHEILLLTISGSDDADAIGKATSEDRDAHRGEEILPDFRVA